MESNQMVRVWDMNGNVIAQGQGYLEEAFRYTDEYGHTHTAYTVEIDGMPVGVVVDGPVQPGNTYAIDAIGNVGSGSYAPAYDAFHNQTYDPDDPNWIKGTDNADTLIGGPGNDTIYYGHGDDSVSGGDGDDLIDDVASHRYTGRNTLDGDTGNDTIYGGNSTNTIHGGAGNDSILAEGGNDYVEGGSGERHRQRRIRKRYHPRR